MNYANAFVYSLGILQFRLLNFSYFLKIINTKEDISSQVKQLQFQNKSIGLVATMGALHPGHISLINQSKAQADITVSSIFVNPTQFNNKEDLINYPKTIDEDIQKLEAAGCDILFLPTVGEMYQADEVWDYEAGELANKLEGEFRPGHYKGVTQIVYKLFRLINPDIAFFGQKDYQQFLVIENMCIDYGLNVKLKLADIIRQEDGLAMSSRNVRLNNKERHTATALFKALTYIKLNFSTLSLQELKEGAEFFFKTNPLLKLEYLKICDLKTLEEVKEKKKCIALLACYVGNTRLIDNMILP